MRTPGSNEQLAKRRNRGLAMLAQGKSTAEVAAKLGVSVRTVRYGRQAAKTPKGKQSTRRPGRPSKMSPEQLRRLESELEKGALAQGYSRDYWTLDRIGWSSQKPQRQPLQRDDETIPIAKTSPGTRS